MNNKNHNLLVVLIAALFLGSSLSLILTPLLIKQFSLNFVSLDMPGMSTKLAYDKTFDILDFAMAGILSFGLFWFNWLGRVVVSRFSKNIKFVFADAALLIFSILTFIQTHFVVFSAKQVLIMIVVLELIYFFTIWVNQGFNIDLIVEELKTAAGKLRLQNGFFIGFLLMLIANSLTTIPALSLSFLLLTPLLFISSSFKKLNRFVESFPGLLSVAVLLFPGNTWQVVGLLAGLSVIAVILSKYRPGLFFSKFVTVFLNPALLIFLVCYNPTFYIGSFDPVEEGYWLAWVERLISGQVLYRDTAVYHMPLIPWGMYLFSLVNGLSIYSERLFLHLLQILGIIIYFFFARTFIKNTFFVLLTTFVYMAITGTMVRNNVEIRVGAALLSLILFNNYFQIKKWWVLFLAGMTGAVSFFLSLEAGIAVLITIFLSLNIFSEAKFSLRIKENLYYLLGVLVVFGLVGSSLLLTGALPGFIEQTVFYAGAFSSGYFNSAMERSVSHAFFHFDVFDEYLDSVTIFWEASKLILYGFVIYGFFKFITNQKPNSESKNAITAAFFGLVLTRAALGRSDWYHLLFVSGIALILVFYSLSKLYESKKVLSVALVLLLVLVVARPSINNNFLEKVLFKYQTYGKLIGDYNAYDFERGKGALSGKEIDPTPTVELVKYIQENSSKNDKIFVFPWNPEIYFYTDRVGATQFDTPYAFFNKSYQMAMINQLKSSPPKFIVYSKDMNFGNLTTGTLQDVTNYINSNFEIIQGYGPYSLMVPKTTNPI